MVNTDHAHFTQDSRPRREKRRSDQQPRGGVWQDKPRPSRARIGTSQPAPLKEAMRAPQPLPKNTRSQNRNVHKRQTVKLTLWVKPVVKRELQRVAEQKGLSISSTGAGLVEWALQQNLAIQQAALLERCIEKAIGKHMRRYSTRLAVLLVYSAFSSEQTRSIVTNILGRQPGMTPDALNTILDSSKKAAKRKITNKTPELADIIAEVEQWFAEQEREDTG